MGISSFDVGQMINGRGGAAHKKTPSRLQSGRRETRGTTSVQSFIAESPLSRPQTRAARCIRRTGGRLLAQGLSESCSGMYSACFPLPPCTDRRLSETKRTGVLVPIVAYGCIIRTIESLVKPYFARLALLRELRYNRAEERNKGGNDDSYRIG